MQDTLSVSNDVAAELATVGDGVLDSLRDRLRCTIRLRGNQLTLEGDEQSVVEARAVVDELVELVEGGHEIGPSTVDAVLGALDQVEDVRQVFEDVVWRHRGKKIAPKTVNQKRYVDAIRDCTVTFAIGPAGTGKTYLAMALAVAALADKQVGRIILTRPAVEAGERLGFLPGTLLEKVDPYLRPLFDALYDMLDADRLASYMEKGIVEVAPLAFMRGRTLNDSFVILDEAQNTSPEQMQMFLTRLGFGSKMVVTGDVTQIDLPREQASGLIQVQHILGPSGRSRVHPVRARRRRPAQARAAHRRGLPCCTRRRRGPSAGSSPAWSRSSSPTGAGRTSRRTPRSSWHGASSPPRGSRTASCGLLFVGPEEMQALKREHLGVDEVTDVLSFPIDGRAELPEGVPRQLGDAVLCPQVVGDAWREPLVHGLLHLLGYDHGDEMEAREVALRG